MIRLLLLMALAFVTKTEALATSIDEDNRVFGSPQFLQTDLGKIHYQFDGDGTETVVFIPGFSVPMIIYKNQQALSRRFGILTFDLFGRGLSAKVHGNYDGDLYVQQLKTLLDELEVLGPVHLVGQSMGGAIATLFANRYPDRVKTLSLLCPAGVPHNMSIAQKALHVPGLGNVLWQFFGKRYLASNFSKNFGQEAPREIEEIYMEQLGEAEFLAAIHSTILQFPLNDIEEEFKLWREKQKPTLIMWGTKDQVLDFSMSAKLKEILPEAQFLAIEDAGHSLSYENFEFVNAAIEIFVISSGLQQPEILDLKNSN